MWGQIKIGHTLTVSAHKRKTATLEIAVFAPVSRISEGVPNLNLALPYGVVPQKKLQTCVDMLCLTQF